MFFKKYQCSICIFGNNFIPYPNILISFKAIYISKSYYISDKLLIQSNYFFILIEFIMTPYSQFSVLSYHLTLQKKCQKFFYKLMVEMELDIILLDVTSYTKN